MFRLYGEGLSLTEIAERTGKSRHTVKNLMHYARLKLGMHSSAEVWRYVQRQGYLAGVPEVEV